MRDDGKRNLLGVLVDTIDYDAVVQRTLAAAQQGRGFTVSPLAVHGVMTGVFDRQHRYRLNHLDIVAPDGQPVRWGLNIMYRLQLSDRVYGPRLMVEMCLAAAVQRLPIYLYGSTRAVLGRLASRLRERFPGLVIAGTEPSKFRRITSEEKMEMVNRIRASGAAMVFVGLGCPRQEVFAYEYREALSLPIIVVGAAFDYHAGLMREPPLALQRAGLQWLYRLAQEPRRLWKRYLLLNPAYVTLCALQALRLWHPDPTNTQPPDLEQSPG